MDSLDSDNVDDLIEILIKDDSTPSDWGEIYSRVLYHTGMAYEEISRRTIPQIIAILDGAEENIAIKLGMPNALGKSSSSSQAMADKPPSLSQFASMAGMFNGI